MGRAPIPLPPLLTLVDPVPLVARDDVWLALGRAWEAISGGARHVVLVPGDAGTGKTRLLTEFARDVHARGAIVLYGTCSEAQTAPYQPFAEALDHVLAAVDPATAAARFGADATELARLVPRRAAALGVPAPAGQGDPDVERARLFGAVTGAIAELARHQPVVFVLDDLHWARRPTIDLLDQLVHDQSLTDVLVVAAYRSAPADTGEALRSVLPDLRRLPGVTRVPLGGFDLAGIEDFVAAVAGHDVDAGLSEAVDVLARQTDGNAFLLVELWQHLVESGQLLCRDGRWTVRGRLTDVSSPEGVREVVAARLERLDEGARRVLEVAAVTGARSTRRIVATAAGTPIDVVLSTLDLMARSRLAGEDGSGAHPLRPRVDPAIGVRRTRQRRAAPPPPRRGAGSRRRRQDRPAGEIARHLIVAVPLAEPREAVAAAVDAADAATAAVAYDDAAGFLRAALAITTDDRVDLLLRLADVTMRAGDVARRRTTASRPTSSPSGPTTTSGGSPPPWRTARRRGAIARARPRPPGSCARSSRSPPTTRRASGCRRR